MKIYPKMNKLNTALLIIDMVNGCAHKDCEDSEINVYFSKIRKIAPKLVGFIDDFRKKVNNNVVFINNTPWTKKYLPNNIQELYTDPMVEYYGEEGDDFPQGFYKVKPEKEDLIITKNTYDAFANPELEKHLRDRKIQYLVITGVFTEGCVLSTIANGFSRGFNFIILKDLIETADSKERQETSRLLKEHVFPYLYGKTIKADNFLKEYD